ncbi:ABC transporter ATP-binding protein [Methylobacterium isbiliense]|jgi:peptide/nickel transport system ATP-binding protein|uniref:Oligopeptide transport ATP-binding protein OppD n=1 Tax=Methylobacterium isbiliense TaxID=315478 RepID=A0ABQ4SD18_9HYPH|nr:ABC transporter ATP-binding protein [Methylobacterium isbiliense]MDN3621405.1 ABC transporter ATP-binding protein [Methylobacterium isbiliense]GJE00959.1 Oligopeptide transport ATP-binding protein OppD [Methylobacterium isbiliense]
MNAPLRTPDAATDALVHVRNLTVDFLGGRKPVRAVGGVDFDLKAGDALALLGESGSGKSVTLRALMRLLPEKRTRIGGTVRVDGQDVLALGRRSLAAYRGGTVAMIFQDPGLALDPVYKIGDQIAEAVVRHEGASFAKGRARALELFERVHIPSPARRLDAYPHEMSGGMRQRAMIALALACKPKLLLADEPTTALDATVQIQILLLLRELQRDLGLAVIFVTHDVGVAVQVADRVAVMYGGHLVEVGASGEVIGTPAHPYTHGLLASRITPDSPKGLRLATIPGSPPDLADPPPGCPFEPRCSLAAPPCRAGLPERVAVAPGHAARCVRIGEALGAAPHAAA